MANNTERIIMETFQQMLAEMPFYKITVSSLVKRAGISPNTFYYHYEDIYDLLEKWIALWLERFSPTDDWRKNAKILLETCQRNEKLVGHILNYLSKEQVETALFSPNDDDLFYKFINNAAADYNVTDQQKRDIADFCRYAVIGFFLRAVWNHSASVVDTMINDLDGYIRCFVKAAMENAGSLNQRHAGSYMI